MRQLNPPSRLLAALTALLVLSPAAHAASGEWEVVSTAPVLVKVRAHGKTNVKELWAETTLDADARDVQATLLDPDQFSRWMPYVKESRTLGKPDAADAGVFAYTRVSLPVIGDRDYVLKSVVSQLVDALGEGAFLQRWEAHPDHLPTRHNIRRIRLNEGSWEVRPSGEGKSRVVYRAQVDPGGVLPAFVVDMANRTGVTGTLEAVEKEARRRGILRRASEARLRSEAAREAREAASRARLAPVPPGRDTRIEDDARGTAD
jgi:hypothetical protein